MTIGVRSLYPVSTLMNIPLKALEAMPGLWWGAGGGGREGERERGRGEMGSWCKCYEVKSLAYHWGEVSISNINNNNNPTESPGGRSPVAGPSSRLRTKRKTAGRVAAWYLPSLGRVRLPRGMSEGLSRVSSARISHTRINRAPTLRSCNHVAIATTDSTLP